MTSSLLPFDKPKGSKNPVGAVIPTTVSSFHAARDVLADPFCEAGAKAALKRGETNHVSRYVDKMLLKS
jgi:hypothetical protein